MFTETQLGISEFLSPEIAGFQGVIKERFSDFNVYELDQALRVVRLNNQSLEKKVDKGDKNVEEADFIYSSVPEAVRTLLSDIQFSMIKSLNSDASFCDPIRINVSEVSKESRKEVHGVLKKFANIETNTNINMEIKASL